MTRDPPYKNTIAAPTDNNTPGRTAGKVGHALHAHHRIDKRIVETPEATGLSLLRIRGDHERVRLQRFDQKTADVGTALTQLPDPPLRAAGGNAPAPTGSTA